MDIKKYLDIKNSPIKDFLLYLIVGGIATVTEWAIFWLLDKMSVKYYIATVIAYVISTFVNWAAGRLIVFKAAKGGVIKEILSIYLASIVGLLLNLGIMWLLIDCMSFNNMLAKIIATALVFAFNFLVRKLLIYKKK